MLSRVLELYEQGRYLDSYEAGKSLGELAQWPGPEGQILAGRLANNLGAPRLGRALHWLALRRWPQHPASIFYGALAYWTRFGTFHAWSKFRDVELPAQASKANQADWAAGKALMLATMRDFMRADEWIDRAMQLDPDSPWIQIEYGEVLERQDKYVQSLAAVERALELQPWFRPAVQSYGAKLIQANRDEDALRFLTAATEHLQSGEVWCQLAAFQQEKKDFEGAWHSILQAEKFWPLASADGAHRKWLSSQMSDIAYYRGDYAQSLELARSVDRPFYKRLVERLEQWLGQPESNEPARIQLPVPFIRQHHDTCAPATLTAIAKYWNHAVEHEEIVQRICYEGTAASDERRWAEENGFAAREFKLTEDTAQQLIRSGFPFTLNTVDPGSAHLQAIVGIDLRRGVLLIQDPSERHVSEAATDRLLEHYQSSGPRAMVMAPQTESARLESIELADEDLYDLHYQVDLALTEHCREDAQRAVEQMIKLDADHRLTLQSQLAITRYDSNTPEHLRLTEQLLQMFPKDANLQLMRLACLNELGTRQQRIAALREACDSSESHPILWARLASELSQDARQHKEARWRLRRVLRGHQTDGRSLALWANLLWDSGDRSAALEAYRLAASVSEKDESYSKSYFSAARYLGQTESALRWLTDRHERLGGRSTQPARTLAGALETLERLPESIEVLEAASVAHPEDGDMHCSIAMTLSRYNMRERAEEHLKLAAGKCAASTYLRTRAAVAMLQGRPQEARDLYCQVLHADPLDTATLEQIVALDCDLDGDEAGEQRLRAAVAQFPHSYSLQTILLQWLRTHRPQAARDDMNGFLGRYPDSAWGQREAAILAYSMHDLDSAERFAIHANELEPNHDLGDYLLGRIAVDRGQTLVARQHYRQAIQKNCDNDSAIGALLQTCDRPAERSEQLSFVLQQLREQTTFGDGVLGYREVATGKIDAETILNGLREARDNRSDLWQTWSAELQQLMSMNRREEAIALARQATERFPLTPRVWVELALAYRAVEDEPSELAALEKARAINPHWVDVARELSDFYLKKEDFSKAEEVIRSVLVVDPRDPVALASLADCLYQSGDKVQALQPLSQACVQAPGYAWAWHKLTEWSRELDQAQTVRRTAQQLIQTRPHDARGYLRFAEACSELDELPEGLQLLDQALQIDPRNVDAYLQKAYYLGRLHRWDEALEACQPTVFNGQLPVTLQMRRAYVLRQKGQAQAAAKSLQQALREDADQFQGWSQLADWAEELGDLPLYREASENLVRLDPHSAVPYGYLADALLRDEDAITGPQNRKLAKEYLRRAIELTPDYAYATGRLIGLQLEDGEISGAEETLKLGGKYLGDGYPESVHLRCLAKRWESQPDLVDQVMSQLIECSSSGPEENPSLIQTVDQFPEKLAREAIAKLTGEIKSAPEAAKLGKLLGRLAARVDLDGELLKLFAELPEGPAWNQTLRFVVRSLPRFERPKQLLDRLVKKHRQRIRDCHDGWAAVAATQLDYGAHREVVAWTRDWPGRGDLSLATCLTIIAANWERFNIKQGRAIIAVALKTALESKEESLADLIYVWGGLDSLIRGDVNAAAGWAQRINPNNLTGWYQMGYRMLVGALELTPQFAKDPALARRSIGTFSPSYFPQDAQFADDRLTLWFFHRIKATLCALHRRPLFRWSELAWAWWIEFNSIQF